MSSPYSFRLDAQLRAALERVAAEQNRTLANMIDTILRNGLAALEKKPSRGLTKQ